MEPRAALLKSSFDLAQMLYTAVVKDLDEAAAAYSLPGGTVPTALAMLAHATYGLDLMSSGASGRPLVLESGGFAAATGITQPDARMSPEWLATEFKLDGLRGYGAAIFAGLDEFLAGATPDDIERMVTSPFGGQVPAGEYLASIGVIHLIGHVGEISTLKGAQGLKGLPF